jgi:iron complex transport system substrate-binding protein
MKLSRNIQINRIYSTVKRIKNMKYRTFSILMLLALLLVSVVSLAAQDDSGDPLPVVEAGFPESSEEPITLFEILEKTDEAITVRHLHGETTIPRNPERIVTDSVTAEALIALGIEPIGFMVWEDRGVEPVMAELAPNMTILPVIEGPNFEQVLTLEPDLIVGGNFSGTYEAERYERMSAIAPTLPFNDGMELAIDDTLRQVGELFDRQEEAEAVITNYNEQVADYRARILPVLGDETVSPLLFFGPSAWLYSPIEDYEGRIYSSNAIGWIYYDLGLTPGPGMINFLNDISEEVIPWVEITGEQLPEIQADHLIVFPNGYGEATEISDGYLEYTESPIWQALPAVKNGNIHIVVGVNVGRGYYTRLANMEALVNALELISEEGSN